MKFDIQRKMFEIQRLIFKNQSCYRNSKCVQNLSFHFQTEFLEFKQFNFEIQKIKLKFQTFMFKGEGSVSAIFGPIQDLIMLVIFCSNTPYNGKIGCFRLIFQVFSILGLKVKKTTKNR